MMQPKSSCSHSIVAPIRLLPALTQELRPRISFSNGMHALEIVDGSPGMRCVKRLGPRARPLFLTLQRAATSGARGAADRGPLRIAFQENKYPVITRVSPY